MLSAAVVGNLIVSLASAGWAAASILRPTLLSGTVASDRGETFYARMYGARAIALGLFSGILPFYAAGWVVATVLFTAAFIQLSDVAIALFSRRYRMAVGALIGTIVPIWCAVMLSA